MKTQYLTATSIDGFIADDNNSLDWLFQFGGPGASLIVAAKDCDAAAAEIGFVRD